MERAASRRRSDGTNGSSMIGVHKLRTVNLRNAVLAAGLAVVAWAVATLPVSTVTLLAGAAAATLLLLRWPWLIWPSLGALLSFTSALKVGAVSATEVVLAGLIVLWFVDGVRRKQLAITFSAPVNGACIFIGVMLISMTQAADLGEAAAEVVKWVEFVVVILLSRQMIAKRHVVWIVSGLLLGSTAQAALGLYQFIYRIGPEWFVILGRFMRASGTFRQPNPFAGYLGMSLPVALSMAIWSWGGLLTVRSLGDWRRLAWATFFTGASAVIGAGLLASWSRGAWLGAAAAVTTVAVLRSRRAALATAIASLLVVVALLLGSFSPQMIPAPLSNRLAALPAYLGLNDVLSQEVNDENFAVIERVAHWAAAIRMWALAPWLGVGPGNYAVVYPNVHLPRWNEALGHAHNLYLNVLAETGLVGLGAFLLFWGAIGVWTWRQLRQALRCGDAWSSALIVGVVGALVHVAVHSVFDNLFVQGMYLQLAIWLSAVECTAPKTAERSL